MLQVSRLSRLLNFTFREAGCVSSDGLCHGCMIGWQTDVTNVQSVSVIHEYTSCGAVIYSELVLVVDIGNCVAQADAMYATTLGW